MDDGHLENVENLHKQEKDAGHKNCENLKKKITEKNNSVGPSEHQTRISTISRFKKLKILDSAIFDGDRKMILVFLTNMALKIKKNEKKNENEK